MKYAVVAATLVISVLIVAVVSAQDTLRIHRITGDWSITSGTADSEIGRVIARGVRKTHIRYSLQGPEGFSIGRRSGKVSYDGTALTDNATLTITARDKSGAKASVSMNQEVQVTVPGAPQIAARQQSNAPTSGTTTASATFSYRGSSPLVSVRIQIEVDPNEEDNSYTYQLGDTLVLKVTTTERISNQGKSKLCFQTNITDDYLCGVYHTNNGDTYTYRYKIKENDGY